MRFVAIPIDKTTQQITTPKIEKKGAGQPEQLIIQYSPVLRYNLLKDEGVYVILASLTVTMEHIEVRRVSITLSIRHYTTSLHE